MFDLERMKKALVGPVVRYPTGLTPTEFREWMKEMAKIEKLNIDVMNTEIAFFGEKIADQYKAYQTEEKFELSWLEHTVQGIMTKYFISLQSGDKFYDMALKRTRTFNPHEEYVDIHSKFVRVLKGNGIEISGLGDDLDMSKLMEQLMPEQD